MKLKALKKIKTAAILLTACSVMFTSCFSTRYVSEQPSLYKQFRGSTESDVKFELGRPSSIREMDSGYVYTYRAGTGKREFLFDDNGVVRNVKSTRTVGVRRFDAGNTVALVLAVTVVIPGLILIMIVSQEDKYNDRRY